MMDSVDDHERFAVKATMLRLLLAQIDRDTDAVDIIQREIESQILEHPDRMRHVLAGLLGIAAAEIVHRHHGNRPAAAKYIEKMVAETLDAAKAAATTPTHDQGDHPPPMGRAAATPCEKCSVRFPELLLIPANFGLTSCFIR